MNITIDIMGALLSIISGYFYIKEKPIAWLISLAAIPFDVIMDLTVGVYGDLLLQALYFILLVYGWHAWRKGTQVEDSLPMLKITTRQIYLFSLIAFFAVAIAWLSLDRYTDSEVAFMDATVTCLGLVAQWLMCRKILESWLLWILVDILYAALYIFKQMPFHGFMALVDAGISVTGYLYWIKEHRRLPSIAQT